MRWLLAVSSLCVLACLPTPHDVLGKSCDTDAECAPHRCRQSVCVASPGTGEVPLPERCKTPLGDSNFENGVGAWESNSSSTALEVQSNVFRTDAPALRVYGIDSSSSRLTSRHSAIIIDAPAKTFCAAAWIQRGTVRNELKFISRRYNGAGDWEDDSPATLPSRLTPTSDDWFRMVTAITTTAAYPHSVNFRISNDDPVMVEYFVDDVRIWEEASGDCAAAVDAGCAP